MLLTRLFPLKSSDLVADAKRYTCLDIIWKRAWESRGSFLDALEEELGCQNEALPLVSHRPLITATSGRTINSKRRECRFSI